MASYTFPDVCVTFHCRLDGVAFTFAQGLQPTAGVLPPQDLFLAPEGEEPPVGTMCRQESCPSTLHSARERRPEEGL